MLSRRRLLTRAAAAVGAAGLPLRALASAEPDRNFIFVVNYGGWDVTRVFTPDALVEPLVHTEATADPGLAGSLPFVDHPDRPSVRQFFTDHWARSAMFNGILVPSVAHENCLHLIMTGTTSSVASDWPAILASRATDLALPGMVISGPSFAGALSGVATRVGSSGQLQALIDGSIATWSDVRVEQSNARAEAVMDDYLARRVAAAADAASGRRQVILDGYRDGLDRSETLKGLANVVNFSSGTSLSAQVDLAVELMSMGLTRVATLSSNYGWDTHADNDLGQSANFEGLFYALRDLMAQLGARPGRGGGSLADETVVVVVSEMGRTPQLNGTNGKDHWPYTSALVVGPGVDGGRVIGGYDTWFYGKKIDPVTGEPDEAGRDLSSDAFGATLLTLAGIDSEEHLPGVTPITGALA